MKFKQPLQSYTPMKKYFFLPVAAGFFLVACSGDGGKSSRYADANDRSRDYEKVPYSEQESSGKYDFKHDLNPDYPLPPPPPPGTNTEEYAKLKENEYKSVANAPLSTFSIDVDKASYSNVRRFISEGSLPPAEAVRVEEMINYFSYTYAQPDVKNPHPFTVNMEVADCPWNPKHKLVHVGLQGKQIKADKIPPQNLVFLVDVSGSMAAENKLPLVKSGLKLLVENLREEDKVAIVTYAGDAGLKLRPTSGDEKAKITEAIDALQSGGSTAGEAGIRVAYETARRFYKKNGNNRVILCTDGDFNVGIQSNDELEKLIEAKRNEGVFLTVLGFGMGNYKDDKMEILADKGNGNYAYIDDILEAKKVLVSEMSGTLLTIAKDVKIQVEFNPALVKGYRLVGYENRMLNAEDFNDDKKDAGEMGAGHSVTALYEIIPAGSDEKVTGAVDPLKYQQLSTKAEGQELLTVKCRYKMPADTASKMFAQPLSDGSRTFFTASENFRFAAAVAQFGMLLRDSEHKGTATFENTLALARSAKGRDDEGYRSEFIRLAEKAELLKKDVVKENM
ncbi:MAG: hypothetical protein FD123_3280 [Bacteroidetes bacterium]|nr:MAG: hypothetical protein FD123_3280 [Bacteroidota bacterium]